MGNAPTMAQLAGEMAELRGAVEQLVSIVVEQSTIASGGDYGGAPAGMTAEAAAKLREPFAAEQLGHVPRITCQACRNSQGKVCQQHSKAKCRTCGQYMTTAHIDLTYAGHAAVTDRLLQVDPGWTWEPMAYDQHGAPLVQNGGLWIRLTVLGVTRPGYGDAENGKGAKEIIGDAIRNGAMRFGVGLDLWSKENLQVMQADAAAVAGVDQGAEPTGRAQSAQGAPEGGSTGEGARGPQRRTQPQQRGDSDERRVSQAQIGHLLGFAGKAGLNGDDGKVDLYRVHRIVEVKFHKASLKMLTRTELDQAKEAIMRYAADPGPSEAYIERQYAADRERDGAPQLVHHVPGIETDDEGRPILGGQGEGEQQ